MVRRAVRQPSQLRRSDRSVKPVAPGVSRKRAGFFSMELVLTLPLLGIILLAVFEFSLLFSARAAVVEASRVGARRACLADATLADVEEQVRKVLPSRLQREVAVRAILGAKSGDVVAVGVQVPMRCAAPDLLWPVGYSLKNKYIYAETRMIKE
ncbi:MAG: pilus assembly protein [Planctomycetes bacterium]|nr:pilus assembly protein [Planctomycetota bacterium]